MNNRTVNQDSQNPSPHIEKNESALAQRNSEKVNVQSPRSNSKKYIFILFKPLVIIAWQIFSFILRICYLNFN